MSTATNTRVESAVHVSSSGPSNKIQEVRNEDETGRTTVVQEGQPGWVIPAIILVALLAAIGLGVGWRGLSYAQESRQALNGDLQTMKQGYTKDIDSLQQRLRKPRRRTPT